MSSISQRPTKRQRREQPRSLMDNESLACVASPDGPIRTPVVDEIVKEIVLERLAKEICKRFNLVLSVPRAKRPMVMKNGKMVPAERTRRKVSDLDPATIILRSRMKIGTNECTRALEAAISGDASAPSLIILAKGVHPPNILAHIPYLAKRVGTPIMLLPGRASQEMGKTMGVKNVAILLFLPRPSGETNASNDDEALDASQTANHDRIDSFVDFIQSKIPESNT